MDGDGALPMEDMDIFDDQGALTARYLLSRGYCCANGCRNCPYVPRHGGVNAVPRDSPEARSRSENQKD